MRIPIPLVLALLAVAAFFGFKQPVAQASPTERMLAVLAQMPANPTMATWTAYANAAAAVGPAFVDSFTVACGDGDPETPITSSVGSMLSYSCQTPAAAETGGTVLVAVGDSALGDPAFATRTSPVYSGDTIREFGGNARREYCRADTGTVTIFCRALVATSSAP